MKYLMIIVCVIMLVTTAHATTWEVTSNGEGGCWVSESTGARVNIGN